MKNKEEIYGMTFILANVFIVLSVIIFSVYLIAPLLGGKLSVKALMHYGSWIILAIVIRIVSQRGRKGQRIRIYEYVIVSFVAVLNFILWFPYPINVVISILSVLGVILSYRVQDKRIKQNSS